MEETEAGEEAVEDSDKTTAQGRKIGTVLAARS